ncbi:hypothetical protein [Nocardia rhizosphaerae]|uniref:Integral membrane protein n=1 Tax=Nocardia rhizosphaerae TaxID=1691571 RepID=A0ABV8L2C3_9NOCA
MSPLLLACILLAASSAVVLARMRFHSELKSDDLDFPRFTAAIASVTAATILGLAEFGDDLLDPAAARIGLGENISDLLKGLYLLSACSFFAGQSANALIESLPGDRTFDSRRCSLIASAVVAVAMVGLHRTSDARTTAIDDNGALADPSGVAYLAVFWTAILVTALLVTAAAAVGVRDHGIHGQLAGMAMAGAVGVVIAAYVLSLLVIDRSQLATWLGTWGQWWTVPGLIGITAAGLLGIPRRPALSLR